MSKVSLTVLNKPLGQLSVKRSVEMAFAVLNLYVKFTLLYVHTIYR